MVVIKTAYHFVDSNLGVEISSKKRGINRKRGYSFGSCSGWEGGNDLPWGRKGMPGGSGVVETIQIKYQMNFIQDSCQKIFPTL